MLIRCSEAEWRKTHWRMEKLAQGTTWTLAKNLGSDHIKII